MGEETAGVLSVELGVFSDILPAASTVIKGLSYRILLRSFSLKSGELTCNGVAVPRGRRRGMRA